MYAWVGENDSFLSCRHCAAFIACRSVEVVFQFNRHLAHHLQALSVDLALALFPTCFITFSFTLFHFQAAQRFTPKARIWRPINEFIPVSELNLASVWPLYKANERLYAFWSRYLGVHMLLRRVMVCNFGNMSTISKNYMFMWDNFY